MAKVSSFVRRLAQEQRDGKVVKVSSSWNSSRSKVSDFVRRKAEEERKKKTTVPSLTAQETSQKSTWFQKGALEDGVTAGNVGKAVVGTGVDVVEDVGTGGLGIFEKALDFLVGVAPYFAEGYYYQNGGGYNLQADAAFKQVNDSAKQLSKDFVAQDIVDESNGRRYPDEQIHECHEFRSVRSVQAKKGDPKQ